MEVATGIQDAIDYIESHLTDDIDTNQIAKRACLSNFYFQRIFKALFGYSIGEYIRFRRLTLAGNELAESDVKVIDIALKYGYETPESFSRAFKEFHGIAPSQAKSQGQMLKTFSRLCVIITLRGGAMDNYKIMEKDAFYVLEKVEKHTVDDEINKNTIPEFWERSWQDGTIKTLIAHMNNSNKLLGICYNSGYSDSKSFDYSIGCMCGDNIKAPDGYRVNLIPARKWIVFECVGAMPESMQNAWHKVCSEIIPSSSYEPTYEFDIEVYSEGNMNSDNYKSEIWIPII